MLVLKIEMWPNGDESKAYEHSRAYISNDARTTLKTRGTHGSYTVRFMQSCRYNPKKVWKQGRAENIHRTRRGLWDILYVALRSIGMEKRNPCIERE